MKLNRGEFTISLQLEKFVSNLYSPDLEWRFTTLRDEFIGL